MKRDDAPEELATRTKKFGLRVVRVFASLVRRDDAQMILGKQMLRAGTSVGAHYREARRARSDLEFISKLETALQELDETQLVRDVDGRRFRPQYKTATPLGRSRRTDRDLGGNGHRSQTAPQSRRRLNSPSSSLIFHPSSFILHPSSFILHPFCPRFLSTIP